MTDYINSKVSYSHSQCTGNMKNPQIFQNVCVTIIQTKTKLFRSDWCEKSFTENGPSQNHPQLCAVLPKAATVITKCSLLLDTLFVDSFGIPF